MTQCKVNKNTFFNKGILLWNIRSVRYIPGNIILVSIEGATKSPCRGWGVEPRVEKAVRLGPEGGVKGIGEG